MKCPVTMTLDEVGVHVALKWIYTDGVFWRVGGYVRKDETLRAVFYQVPCHRSFLGF